MRIALLVMLVGCSGGGFVAKPLPELVANRSPTVPIEVQALQLPAGEALVWNVSWHGMTIGRAEMSTGDQEIATKFETGALASSIAKVHYDLTTVLDRPAALPRTASETLAHDGTTTHHEVAFDGSTYSFADPPASHAVPRGSAHDLNTALGTIRAWAIPEAAAGFLYVVHAGRLYQVTLARPVPEMLLGTQTLKIACRIRPHDGTGDVVALSIWLTANEARIPMRFEIAGDDSQLTAELVDE